ncbi:uncharacterized protein LOC101462300 [Ceratitis capitata]|uniref:uncharacterized protein LOC101462300 n=1 Tax=Ceratitis capitata TaxID=7213 RepID=UPI000618908A|nr:uncharacterized protein LOC101462300 [Ceratitis capitata]
MWLLHYNSFAFLVCTLYVFGIHTSVVASENMDTVTPSLPDPYLVKPTRESFTNTPRPSGASQVTADCLANSLDSDSIYCRGSRAIRNVIQNLNRRDKPLVLMRGLEIVPIASENSVTSTESTLDGDESFLGCVSEYLRSHELNINFADLLADESERYLAYDLARNGQTQADGSQEARKKDKGQGVILAMALMFGKMLAVMGLGGIGAMAMKALGVAMTALMMAGLVGLKSLMQHGHESSHSVQYLTSEGHHHMRRRRSGTDSLGMAYRGWLQRNIQREQKVAGEMRN